VVVGIIGILAAVAIPAYNRYQRNAAQNSLIASMRNISKGFMACVTTDTFANCDTLGKIRVNCDACNAPKHASPSWCIDSEVESSGDTFMACVGVNAQTGSFGITNNWDESDCSVFEDTTNGCNSNANNICTSTPETSSGAGDGSCTGTFIGATGTCQIAGQCS